LKNLKNNSEDLKNIRTNEKALLSGGNYAFESNKNSGMICYIHHVFQLFYEDNREL